MLTNLYFGTLSRQTMPLVTVASAPVPGADAGQEQLLEEERHRHMSHIVALV